MADSRSRAADSKSNRLSGLGGAGASRVVDVSNDQPAAALDNRNRSRRLSFTRSPYGLRRSHQRARRHARTLRPAERSGPAARFGGSAQPRGSTTDAHWAMQQPTRE